MAPQVRSKIGMSIAATKTATEEFRGGYCEKGSAIISTKELLNNIANVGERIEPSPDQDAMYRALVFLPWLLPSE
jgi:hypothetical protein